MTDARLSDAIGQKRAAAYVIDEPQFHHEHASDVPHRLAGLFESISIVDAMLPAIFQHSTSERGICTGTRLKKWREHR